jgi:hypothetical protein
MNETLDEGKEDDDILEQNIISISTGKIRER